MEITGLLSLFVIQLLSDGDSWRPITHLVKVDIISGLVSALTVSIDSYFRDHWPLWPEFSGIYFNVYEGKACDRLRLPRELPRAQRMAFRRVRRTDVEYCRCAWCPAQSFNRQSKGSLSGLLAFLAVVGTSRLTWPRLSSLRAHRWPPGGHALALLNEQYRGTPRVHVHIASLAAQSAASLPPHARAPIPLAPGHPPTFHLRRASM
ncbi:hypothetical protein DFH94DRAFT_712149 [Russula ochroleuca]|uniref:Uncharacterized protein n=1 Tax=Russula ochroleuca TaxID=152965 RepID=A0A9P5TDD1_9AGAM|nr:hypothetical protein DFH94DRAFT_712149 [Russula ochroleuca]